MNLNRKILFGFLVMLAFLVAGVSMTWWEALQADRNLRDNSLRQAQMVGQMVNVGVVKTLTGTEQDLQNIEYQRLKQQFGEVRETSKDFRFVYLLGRNADGVIYVMVDSEPTISPDYSPPGDSYTEAPAEISRVFETGTATTHGPYTDRWGSWISSLVPLKDPVTGNVITVLGIDIDAGVWRGEIFKESALPLSLMLVLMAITFLWITSLRARLKLSESESKYRLLSEALREEEEYLKNIFNSMLAGVLVIDVESHTIVDVNEAAAKMIGKAKSELIDLVCHNHVCPVEVGKCPITDLHQKVDNSDRKLITANGGSLEIIKSVVPIVKNGRKQLLEVFIDVSEKKKANEALRLSEERFRSIFDNSPIAKELYDSEGTLVDVNPACCELFGIESAEAVKGFKLFKDPNIPPAKLQLLQKGERIRYEAAFNFDVVHRLNIYKTTRRGKAELDILITPIKKGDSFISGYLVQILDITERKRAEEALKEANQLFATVANASTAIVWMSGTDKLCTWFNEPWLKFTGRTMEQELGNGWAEGVHPDDLERCLKIYTEAFDKREPFIMEYRLRRFDGEYRWIMDPGVPRYDYRGNFVGYIGSCLDITERKQAEKTLQKNEEMLNDVGAMAKVGGWELDVINNQVHWTKTTYQIHDVSMDKNYDLSKAILFYDMPGRTTLEKAIQNCIEKGESFDLELAFTSAKGRHLWTHSIGHAVTENGKITSLKGTFQDITESKRAEEQLRALYEEEKAIREELEEEAKARIRFIDVLAHELKGPLTPLLASSEMLSEVLTQDAESVERKLANNILNGTNTLISRLDELLDVARFARGSITLNLEPTDTRKFLDKVVSIYAPSITRNKQHLSYDLAEDLPIASLDQSRLEQVIINLLSNASKYSPQGSSIYLSAHKMDNQIQIAVKDEGIGISPAELKKLFQPYQRVGKSQQKIQGLGLGLTVLKYIIEAHQGKIWVDSKLGKGSTVSFTIPIK